MYVEQMVGGVTNGQNDLQWVDVYSDEETNHGGTKIWSRLNLYMLFKMIHK